MRKRGFLAAALCGMLAAACAAPATAGAASGVTSARAAGFIDRLYGTCLGRAADTAGRSSWVRALTSGAATGADAAAGFYGSVEFINLNLCNGCFVERLYEGLLDRDADPAGLSGWVTSLESGTTREAVINGLIGSDEFTSVCASYGMARGGERAVPGTSSMLPVDSCTECGAESGISLFVKSLYEDVLGRDYDGKGLEGWSLSLRSGAINGALAARGFFDSDEFKSRHVCDSCLVEMMYHVLLGRGADATGFAGWTSVLESGGSRDAVLAGFTGSAEYALKCASYGLPAGTFTPTAYVTDYSECTICSTQTAAGQYVERLYEAALYREPSDAELSAWGDALAATSAAEAAVGILTSAEAMRGRSDGSFIRTAYDGLLGRSVDSTGDASWTALLRGGMSRADAVRAMAGSDEARAITSKLDGWAAAVRDARDTMESSAAERDAASADAEKAATAMSAAGVTEGSAAADAAACEAAEQSLTLASEVMSAAGRKEAADTALAGAQAAVEDVEKDADTARALELYESWKKRLADDEYALTDAGIAEWTAEWEAEKAERKAAWDAAVTATAEAQEAVDAARAKVDEGYMGYLNWKIENGLSRGNDSETAILTLTELRAYEDCRQYVDMGAEGDASSLENVRNAAESMLAYQQLRDQYEAEDNKGRRQLLTNDGIMAEAILSTMASNAMGAHALSSDCLYFGRSEPDTTGYAVRRLYADEKALYDAGERGFYKVGHYQVMDKAENFLVGWGVTQNGRYKWCENLSITDSELQYIENYGGSGMSKDQTLCSVTVQTWYDTFMTYYNATAGALEEAEAALKAAGTAEYNAKQAYGRAGGTEIWDDESLYANPSGFPAPAGYSSYEEYLKARYEGLIEKYGYENQLAGHISKLTDYTIPYDRRIVESYYNRLPEEYAALATAEAEAESADAALGAAVAAAGAGNYTSTRPTSTEARAVLAERTSERDAARERHERSRAYAEAVSEAKARLEAATSALDAAERKLNGLLDIYYR